MNSESIDYLMTTRLGERGTMTLPKEYRDALNLEAGSPVTLLRLGDGLLLIPEQKRFEQLCESISKRLESVGVTEAALQATLPEVRQKQMQRRYPKLFENKKARGKANTL